MRNVCILCLLLVALIFLAACGRSNQPEAEPIIPMVEETPQPVQLPPPPPEPPQPEPIAKAFPQTLQDVLEIANQRRHELVRTTRDNLLRLTYGREPQTIDISRFRDNELAEYVSSEDAIADTEELFELMRQFYGAYIYFGGDDVFFPLLEQIIANLETRETWRPEQFGSLLRRYLSTVISDNHFWIHNHQLSVSYNFLRPATRCEKAVFERSEAGLRNRATGLYVTDVIVNDSSVNIEEVFRLSLSPGGDLYYSVVMLHPMGRTPESVAIVYESGEYDIIPLNRLISMQRTPRPTSLTHRYDIPIVTIMQMGFPDTEYGHDWAGARRFLAYAEELRDEPVIIVDVRSNGGGNGTLAPRWLHILTGQLVPVNYYGLRVWNYDNFRYRWQGQDAPPGPWSICMDISATYAPSERFGDNHILMHTMPAEIIENDQLIILLTDRFSASAADDFADRMLNLKNTLIIGQNTAGVLHTDMFFPNLSLPRSGLALSLGITIHIHPQGHLPEGIGIAPDLWVNGDALAAALALLTAN